jgi:exodeoxyribonuclease VII large subunit
VQGQEAVPDIVRGIAALNAWHPRLDVLIVGRGGGSLEDLWAFNEEKVARAIAASEIPVISAVGHEIDYTIADFVADLRAPTPSAAAELVVKSEAELRQQLQGLLARMQTVTQQTVRHARTTLDRLSTSRVLREPRRLVEARQQYVDDLLLQLEKGWQNSFQERTRRVQQATRTLVRRNPRVRWQRLRTHLNTLHHRLDTALRAQLNLHREKLNGLGSTLHSLSPLAVLGRGYSICRDPVTQRLMTSTADVHAGQRVEVLLSDGQLTCTVDEIHQRESDGGRFDLRASREALRGNRRGPGN